MSEKKKPTTCYSGVAGSTCLECGEPMSKHGPQENAAPKYWSCPPDGDARIGEEIRRENEARQTASVDDKSGRAAKRKHSTLSGLSPEVEARACVAVSEQVRVAMRDATLVLHARLGLPTGAAVVVVTRVMLTTVATAFFAVARGEMRDDIEGMVSTIWKIAFADARVAVRQVDDRKVEEEHAAKKGAN